MRLDIRGLVSRQHARRLETIELSGDFFGWRRYGRGSRCGNCRLGRGRPVVAIIWPHALAHHSSARQIALTFDDGPNPAVTPQLLNLLDRYSARATFFVIGKFARACPDLVREISARGHSLGNHSHTHANLFLRSGAGIRDEILRCQDAVVAATRLYPPRSMRPPYGYRIPCCGRKFAARECAMS